MSHCVTQAPLCAGERNTTAAACQSIPPHYPGPHAGLEDQQGRWPQDSWCAGTGQPRWVAEKPGAMLRRRERTARWRRVRGGGRAPPRSPGPGMEDCSKTLPRPGVFQHHLQDGGWLVTHCANARSRGVMREAPR